LREFGVAEVVAEDAYQLPGGAQFDIHGGKSKYSMHTWGFTFVEMEWMKGWCSRGCAAALRATLRAVAPYTGDENADTNLRKAKVTAANSVLSVDTGFLKEARWKS
jgi:hypothetical protein